MRRQVARLVGVVSVALLAVGVLAVPAGADEVDTLTSAYRVANFGTSRGSIQVAVDVHALLRDGPDDDATDDFNEVVGQRGAFRVQGMSTGIRRVQVDTAYLGQPDGIIESTRVGPLANGTRLVRGTTTSAAGNSWNGDAGSEVLYCSVRLRVRFSARLDTNALYRNTLLSNEFRVPSGNSVDCRP